MPFLYVLIILLGGILGLTFSTETNSFRTLPISVKVAEAANVRSDFVFKIDCSRNGTTFTLWSDASNVPVKAEDYVDVICEKPEFSIYSNTNGTVRGVASNDLSKLSQFTSEQAVQMGQILASKAVASTVDVGANLREEINKLRLEQATGFLSSFMIIKNIVVVIACAFSALILMVLAFMLMVVLEDKGRIEDEIESIWSVVILALTFFIVCPGVFYSNARPSDEQLTSELRGLSEVTAGSASYQPTAIHTICHEGYWTQLVSYEGPTQKAVVLPTPSNCTRTSELAIAVLKLPNGKWESTYGSSWDGIEYSISLNSLIEQHKEFFEPRQIRESFTKANAKLTEQLKLEASDSAQSSITPTE